MNSFSSTDPTATNSGMAEFTIYLKQEASTVYMLGEADIVH